MERREFVSAVGATVAGAGLAGCLRSDSVNVLAAGSLAVTLDRGVGPEFERDTGTSYQGEYYGTNAVVRMVESRSKNPDVVVSADAELLRDRLYGEFTNWDAVFASNSVVITYNPDTRIGERLDDGDDWYEVFADASQGEIAISDPDLDPLGYRAVHLFELAEKRYGIDGFRDEMLDTLYVEPEEPQLLTDVRAGTRSAAIAYRNMAVDHDLAFRELPDELDFSDPELADHYSNVSYTTDEGYVAEGTPVLYNLTVLEAADSHDAGVEFADYLLENRRILAETGFTLPEVRFHGDVPEMVRDV